MLLLDWLQDNIFSLNTNKNGIFHVYMTTSVSAYDIIQIMNIFSLIYPFSPSLWETARYRLKYCLKGPLNPNNQSINQIILNDYCADISFVTFSHHVDGGNS